MAHHALHDALRLPPWVFPFEGSEDKPIYPLNAKSETTGDLWRELEAALVPVENFYELPHLARSNGGARQCDLALSL